MASYEEEEFMLEVGIGKIHGASESELLIEGRSDPPKGTTYDVIRVQIKDIRIANASRA